MEHILRNPDDVPKGNIKLKILCSRCKNVFIGRGSLTDITIACEICKTCLREIRSNKKIQKMSLSEKAEMALKEAVRGVIEEHARMDLPVAIWRNGKVVNVPATQLLRKRA